MIATDGPETPELPAYKNLVTRALHAFSTAQSKGSVAFHLTKNIPAAAGLGGGSSDAAAALRLLARLWDLSAADIRSVAASLGSDVPFFLRGGAQVASGRGELLEPLPDTGPVGLVIATPPIAVPNKTARLYAELRAAHYSDGTATQRLARKIRRGLQPAAEDYVNVFDAVADSVFAGLSEFRRRFERVVGRRALLAGAGPTLFAVRDDLDDRLDIQDVRTGLARQGFKAIAASTTSAELSTATG